MITMRGKVCDFITFALIEWKIQKALLTSYIKSRYGSKCRKRHG